MYFTRMISSINISIFVIVFIPVHVLTVSYKNKLERSQIEVDGQTGLSSCTYENRHYRPGELFTPHPCTSCLCPQNGGAVKCSYVQCTSDPHCLVYDPDHEGTQCCPKCVERGCHYNNKTYPAGARIPTDVCRICYCPWEGGDARCVSHECKTPQCVDPVIIPGNCCPSCPNGANCKLGRFTLRADTVYHINKCLTCMCRKVAPDAPAAKRVARCWKKATC